jgi:hypothetical protein
MSEKREVGMNAQFRIDHISLNVRDLATSAWVSCIAGCHSQAFRI